MKNWVDTFWANKAFADNIPAMLEAMDEIREEKIQEAEDRRKVMVGYASTIRMLSGLENKDEKK